MCLAPAYPNPFNPNTTITFDLAREMNVTLSAYDILGNQVATLVKGSMSAGTHEVTFNTTNLPSGIYFCRLQAGDFHRHKS
ncbi:MAG: T9SS type A sorting domain-containing protein [bacterium]|nr:T9SS type A sorting domain-containing protein [bacterium]